MALHNPLPMRAWIRGCWMLAYRVPEAAARPLVPEPLELVTRGGFAFLNIVFARMEGMRPAGLPAGLGVDYWHVGYRLQVRAATPEGEREGLYFLRSECDHRVLGGIGNALTAFRFHPGRVQAELGDRIRLRVESAGGGGEALLDPSFPPSLGEGSPFPSLAEAESFLRYNPLGMATAGPRKVALLDIAHGPWDLRTLRVERQCFPLAQALGAVPELAFALAPLEYHFRRGRVVEVRR